MPPQALCRLGGRGEACLEVLLRHGALLPGDKAQDEDDDGGGVGSSSLGDAQLYVVAAGTLGLGRLVRFGQGLGAPCSCLLLEDGEGERIEPIGDTLQELGAAVGDEVDLARSRQFEGAE